MSFGTAALGRGACAFVQPLKSVSSEGKSPPIGGGPMLPSMPPPIGGAFMPPIVPPPPMPLSIPPPMPPMPLSMPAPPMPPMLPSMPLPMVLPPPMLLSIPTLPSMPPSVGLNALFMLGSEMPSLTLSSYKNPAGWNMSNQQNLFLFGPARLNAAVNKSGSNAPSGGA
eukprot:3462918-Rhodomonas_salina.1